MSKGTILIIDDNRMNLELGAELLEEAGFEVILAADGFTGMAAANAYRPNLILLDLHLPDHDGFSLAREIKALPALQEIPIAAFTAMTTHEAEKKAIACGCSTVITKPVDLDTFVETVEDCLALTLRADDASGTMLTQSKPPEGSEEIQPIGVSSTVEQHLSALVRHDLKSPLCSSKTVLEILLADKLGPLNATQREVVSETLESQIAVLAILDLLHKLFLYEKGECLLAIEPVEPDAIIVELINGALQPLIKDTACQVNLNISSPSQAISADKQELSQALEILLRRQIKSLTAPGILNISINSESQDLVLRIEQSKGSAQDSVKQSTQDALEWDYCLQVLNAIQCNLLQDEKGLSISFLRVLK